MGAIGLAIGVVAAPLATRTMTSLLYDVTPADPLRTGVDRPRRVLRSRAQGGARRSGRRAAVRVTTDLKGSNCTCQLAQDPRPLSGACYRTAAREASGRVLTTDA
jgi:hypothetical protein